MTQQYDWVLEQGRKHKRLLELRNLISLEIARQEPFSETSIKISLLMIKRIHGEDAYQETLRQFGLAELDAA